VFSPSEPTALPDVSGLLSFLFLLRVLCAFAVQYFLFFVFFVNFVVIIFLLFRGYRRGPV
jgi:hypothetical protein